MPPRRQRKRKVIQVKDPATFFDDLEDIFDYEMPADIFAELIYDYSFARNFNDYLELFCERCFSGRYGLIAGERIDGSPLKNSFLGCDEQELNTWIEEYGKLCQTFVTMRNKMDLILAKFLTSSADVSTELRERIYEIGAKIVQYKAYNRSYQSDFFLTALLNVSDGLNISGRYISKLGYYIGNQQAFEFCKTYEFITVLSESDIATLGEHCPWFAEMCEQYKMQLHEQHLRDYFVHIVVDEPSEEFPRLLAELKTEAGHKYLNVLYNTIFRVLERMPKSNLNFEIEASLAKLMTEIKDAVNSVQAQGEFMDLIQQNCHEIANLHDCFRPLVFLFYQKQIIDGKVIIAWYERARGKGKLSFYTQIEQFYQWLKE